MYAGYGLAVIPILFYILSLVLIGLGIYVSILLIKALNIYIKKNS